MAPQLIKIRRGILQRPDERCHLVGLDSRQVVADADVIHRIDATLETGGVGKDAEPARGLEDFDQVHRFRVLHERIGHLEFLRPLHVVADVGDVDARPGNLQVIVDLHRLELNDAAARQPGERDVLGHLRVRTCSRPYRRRSPARKVRRAEVKLFVRDKPLAHRQVEDRTAHLNLSPHSTHKVRERNWSELCHQSVNF